MSGVSCERGVEYQVKGLECQVRGGVIVGVRVGVRIGVGVGFGLRLGLWLRIMILVRGWRI